MSWASLGGHFMTKAGFGGMLGQFQMIKDKFGIIWGQCCANILGAPTEEKTRHAVRDILRNRLEALSLESVGIGLGSVRCRFCVILFWGESVWRKCWVWTPTDFGLGKSQSGIPDHNSPALSLVKNTFWSASQINSQ